MKKAWHKVPVRAIKLVVRALLPGHSSKGLWVAKAIVGGELCVSARMKDSMNNIFNIKRDINQLRQAKEQIRQTGRKIEDKSPLIGSVARSIFVVIKWLIFIGIAITISTIIYYYAIEVPRDARQKAKKDEEHQFQNIKYQDCLRECNLQYPDSGLILPNGPQSKSSLEEKRLRNNCLSGCEKVWTTLYLRP